MPAIPHWPALLKAKPASANVDHCLAISSRKRRRKWWHSKASVALLLLLLGFLSSNILPFASAPASQELLSSLRPCKDARLKAAASFLVSQNSRNHEEKKLMACLAQAEDKSWKEVKSTVEKHSGAAAPAFNAAMSASLGLGEYPAGVKLYELMCRRRVSKNIVSYSLAMKLFGKMQLDSKVQEVFEEAEAAGALDISARIDAAAAQGQLTTAAGLIDYADQHGLSLDTCDFNAVLDACARTQENITRVPQAADFVLQEMTSRSILPDVITYTNLVRATRHAEDSRLLHDIWDEMKDAGIEPDPLFAGVMLSTVLWQPTNYKNTTRWAMEHVSSDRLALAQRLLADFQAASVRPSIVHRKLSKALEILRGNS